MTDRLLMQQAREAGFEVDEGLFPFEAAEDKYIGTERTLERFAALVAAPLQAKIDRLMLEYCPDEMTQEQLNEWAKNQKPPAFLRRAGSFGHE